MRLRTVCLYVREEQAPTAFAKSVDVMSEYRQLLFEFRSDRTLAFRELPRTNYFKFIVSGDPVEL